GLLLSPARDSTITYISALNQPVSGATAEATPVATLLTTHLAAVVIFIGCTVSAFFNK
ncbi:MAG: hypothetical protein HYX67_16785, partial [Candidatus Melainabacteria bacterium]|nr:hypothetical protein [Candidatus Melainabacteria bacterium]